MAKPDFHPSAEEIARFWAKVDKKGDDECWPWLASVSHPERPHCDYGQFAACSTVWAAHRFSYMLANGLTSLPPGIDVRHLCHHPRCVNPKHLASGTRKENMQDSVKADRLVRGERCHQAKLTAELVKEIRRRFWEEGLTVGQLARQYGVKSSVMGKVIRNFTWKDDSYIPPIYVNTGRGYTPQMRKRDDE